MRLFLVFFSAIVSLAGLAEPTERVPLPIATRGRPAGCASFYEILGKATDYQNGQSQAFTKYFELIRNGGDYLQNAHPFQRLHEEARGDKYPDSQVGLIGRFESDFLEIVARKLGDTEPVDIASLERLRNRWGLSHADILLYFELMAEHGPLKDQEPQALRRWREWYGRLAHQLESSPEYRQRYYFYLDRLTQIPVSQIARELNVSALDVYKEMRGLGLSVNVEFDRKLTNSEVGAIRNRLRNCSDFRPEWMAFVTEDRSRLEISRQLKTWGVSTADAAKLAGLGPVAHLYIDHHHREKLRGQSWDRILTYENRDYAEEELLVHLLTMIHTNGTWNERYHAVAIELNRLAGTGNPQDEGYRSEASVSKKWGEVGHTNSPNHANSNRERGLSIPEHLVGSPGGRLSGGQIQGTAVRNRTEHYNPLYGYLKLNGKQMVEPTVEFIYDHVSWTQKRIAEELGMTSHELVKFLEARGTNLSEIRDKKTVEYLSSQTLLTAPDLALKKYLEEALGVDWNSENSEKTVANVIEKLSALYPDMFASSKEKEAFTYHWQELIGKDGLSSILRSVEGAQAQDVYSPGKLRRLEEFLLALVALKNKTRPNKLITTSRDLENAFGVDPIYSGRAVQEQFTKLFLGNPSVVKSYFENHMGVKWSTSRSELFVQNVVDALTKQDPEVFSSQKMEPFLEKWKPVITGGFLKSLYSPKDLGASPLEPIAPKNIAQFQRFLQEIAFLRTGTSNKYPLMSFEDLEKVLGTKSQNQKQFIDEPTLVQQHALLENGKDSVIRRYFSNHLGAGWPVETSENFVSEVVTQMAERNHDMFLSQSDRDSFIGKWQTKIKGHFLGTMLLQKDPSDKLKGPRHPSNTLIFHDFLKELSELKTKNKVTKPILSEKDLVTALGNYLKPGTELKSKEVLQAEINEQFNNLYRGANSGAKRYFEGYLGVPYTASESELFVKALTEKIAWMHPGTFTSLPQKEAFIAKWQNSINGQMIAKGGVPKDTTVIEKGPKAPGNITLVQDFFQELAELKTKTKRSTPIASVNDLISVFGEDAIFGYRSVDRQYQGLFLGRPPAIKTYVESELATKWDWNHSDQTVANIISALAKKYPHMFKEGEQEAFVAEWQNQIRGKFLYNATETKRNTTDIPKSRGNVILVQKFFLALSARIKGETRKKAIETSADLAQALTR